jgi:hypothetical protein
MDIKGYNFYVFGCSHTANMYCDTYPYFENCNFINFAYGGNCNDKILRELKEQIISVTNNFTKKADKVYFNIQFTYFNRTEFYSDIDKKYLTFHSPNILNQHIVTKIESGNIYDEFYEKWLTYFFDEETRLKEVLRECRILKNLMDTFDIKFSWYLWAGIHLEETINSKKELIEKKVILEKEFQKLNFAKFDDYWYFEDYAIKHKLRLIDVNGNNDQHLTQESNHLLADIIAKLFYSKV